MVCFVRLWGLRRVILGLCGSVKIMPLCSIISHQEQASLTIVFCDHVLVMIIPLYHTNILT